MSSRISGNRPPRDRLVRPAAREAAAAAGERPPRRTRGAAVSAAPARPRSAARPDRREQADAPRREPRRAAPEATGSVPEDMLILMQELTELLTWENGELKAHRVDSIRETVERKEALSRAYLEKMIAIKRKPEHLKELPDARRAALAEAGHRLDAAMERNGALLKAKIDTVNRLMGAVVDAVREYKADQAAAYAGNGRMDDRHTGPRGSAVALNQEF